MASKSKLRNLIIKELEAIIKKYPTKRRTQIVYEHEVEEYDESQQIEDYPVNIFLSKDGYFKKIIPQSLRVSSDQKFKEGDGLRQTFESTNKAEIIFLTNQGQAYKAHLYDFDDTKASVLGDYLPQKLGMDENEAPILMLLPGDFSGNLVYVFENGKIAKVELSSFATKSNRRKLTGAYHMGSPLVAAFHTTPDAEIALYSQSRILIVNTAQLQAKTTRAAQGVAVMTLKKNQQVIRATLLHEAGIENIARYRTRTLPAAGALIKEEDAPDKQMSLL